MLGTANAVYMKLVSVWCRSWTSPYAGREDGQRQEVGVDWNLSWSLTTSKPITLTIGLSFTMELNTYLVQRLSKSALYWSTKASIREITQVAYIAPSSVLALQELKAKWLLPNCCLPNLVQNVPCGSGRELEGCEVQFIYVDIIKPYTHTYIYVCMYIYIYVCICVAYIRYVVICLVLFGETVLLSKMTITEHVLCAKLCANCLTYII